MNERIQELAEQAGMYVDLYGKPWPKSMSAEECEAAYKKFAELIVSECVGIVDKIVPPGYADYPDYRDQIEKSFRRECAIEIKKHFGVDYAR